MLELHEWKHSRAVLRGGGGGDVTSLPDLSVDGSSQRGQVVGGSGEWRVASGTKTVASGRRTVASSQWPGNAKGEITAKKSCRTNPICSWFQRYSLVRCYLGPTMAKSSRKNEALEPVPERPQPFAVKASSAHGPSGTGFFLSLPDDFSENVHRGLLEAVAGSRLVTRPTVPRPVNFQSPTAGPLPTVRRGSADPAVRRDRRCRGRCSG